MMIYEMRSKDLVHVEASNSYNVHLVYGNYSILYTDKYKVRFCVEMRQIPKFAGSCI